MRILPLLIVGLLPLAASATTEPRMLTLSSVSDRTVTVDAIAIAKAAPDKVELHLEIKSVQPSVKESRAVVTASLQRLLAALKAAGLEQKALTISDVDQGRDYEWNQRKRVFNGFYAAFNVRLTITDFALLPRVQSEILTDDLIEVKGMNRLSDHEGELRQKALADAAAVARKKAEILASALGAKVGAVVQITEKSFDSPQFNNRANWNLASNVINDESGAASAEVQEIVVRAAVNVQFELVQ